jgi:hypothetical protein
MTLQVVLFGRDGGVVIASDTCVERIKPGRNSRITDSGSKIVIVPGLAYTFAGDECAKEVGAAVAKKIAETSKPLPYDFIDEASNRALEEYKITVGSEFSETYRKIIWVQTESDRFAIWSSFYDSRDRKFVLLTPDVKFDGKCRVFAGDEFNLARYIVEHYYDKDKYSLRNVSSLKRLAAHMILTGNTFNSACVNGLEIVVGNSEGFTWVPREEIQALAELSRRIHEENDSYFKDQNPIP